MSKTTLPAPPQSSFAAPLSSRKAAANFAVSNSSVASSTRFRIDALDLDFLVRVARTSLWLGALLTILAGLVTRSWFFGMSFAIGTALGVILLHSQTWFVQNLTKAKVQKTPSRVPVAVLLPAKYLLLLLFVGAIIHFNLVNAVAFVAGATVVQVVIVAKVLGRMMTQNRASIYETYVKKGRNDH